MVDEEIPFGPLLGSTGSWDWPWNKVIYNLEPSPETSNSRLYSVFQYSYLISHTRYGQYVGVLDPSFTAAQTAQLEKVLVRTRGLLRRQQHTKHDTQLSEFKLIPPSTLGRTDCLHF